MKASREREEGAGREGRRVGGWMGARKRNKERREDRWRREGGCMAWPVSVGRR